MQIYHPLLLKLESIIFLLFILIMKCFQIQKIIKSQIINFQVPIVQPHLIFNISLYLPDVFTLESLKKKKFKTFQIQMESPSNISANPSSRIILSKNQPRHEFAVYHPMHAYILQCLYVVLYIYIYMYMNVLTFYKNSTTLYITFYNLIYLLSVIVLRFICYGTFTINHCFNLDQ